MVTAKAGAAPIAEATKFSRSNKISSRSTSRDAASISGSGYRVGDLLDAVDPV